jgi:hypothetical protein
MDLILDALNGKVNPGTLYRRAYDYLQSSENREKVKTASQILPATYPVSFREILYR